MDELSPVLRVGQLVVYTTLGVVAVRQWLRSRTAPAAWVALTFGTLGAVILSSWVLPSDGREVPGIVTKVLVSGLVFFPYFLYRFARTFVGWVRWVYWGANALTAGLVLAAFAIDIPVEDEPRTTAFNAFVFVFVLHWVGLTGLVTARLWRHGRHQPPVARLRMRLLAAGGLGMIGALVIAAFAPPGNEVGAVDLTGQLLALVSGPLFLLGFSPPTIVRTWWRQWSARNVLPAEMALMEAATPGDVGAIVLPEASDLMGGRGAVLISSDGEVFGRYGLHEDEAGDIAAEFLRGGEPADVLTMRMENGILAVQCTSFTPYFGRDETELLSRIAALADLALTRTELMERERVAADRLREAQALAHVGSWEWDFRTGEIKWSDELYRIYGYQPGDIRPTPELVLEFVHPDDLDLVRSQLSTIADGDDTAPRIDYRIVLPDGEEKYLHARGRVDVGTDGHAARAVGTAQDITARKREESTRDRFIANAAHELRTPLTSLLGFAQLLSQPGALTGDQVESARVALDRSGGRLRTLVDNLLDLTKLQQGNLEVILTAVDVTAALDDALAAALPPDGKVVHRVGAPNVLALANRLRLEQILVNLLTNAYRYGGNHIEVVVAVNGGALRLTVADDGPGVEADLVPHLFDPFTRSPAAADAGGSGLGLAIAASAAAAMGATLSYAPPPDGGACFVLELKAAT